MRSSKRKRAPLIALVVLGSVCASIAAGQTTPRARSGGPFLPLSAVGGCGSGNICAFGNVIYSVQNLDRSIAFYHEVLGLTVNVLEKTPSSAPGTQKLVNAPGVKLRRAVAPIPGTPFQLELTEFSGVPLAAVGPWRMQDPGNLDLIFRVRDLDSMLAAAQRHGATILTTGGEPLSRTDPTTGARNRTIFMRDPDGFIFELRQFYPETTPDDGNSAVISADVGETTADPQKAERFWDAVGGVNVKVGTRFNGETVEMQLGATEGPTGKGRLRGSVATIAGTKTSWRLFQFTGQPHRTLAPRPVDPGAPALQFRLQNIDAAMQAVTANGGEIVSSDGKVAQQGRAVFARDPDGLLLVFVMLGR